MTKFLVSGENDVRLDVFLVEKTSFSRSYIKTLNDEGRILVNGKTQKAGYKLKIGDQIEIDEKEVEKISAEAEDIPLEIVYEDDDMLVINKQVGLVVHHYFVDDEACCALCKEATACGY